MNGLSWNSKDTLIAIVLAIVGAATSVGIGGYRAFPVTFANWLEYAPEHDVAPWAIIGLIVGAGLGIVIRLNSK
jgi:hypothetical protein